ncbi:MAG: MFS transporter, partial [Sphingomonadales bacterium]
ESDAAEAPVAAIKGHEVGLGEALRSWRYWTIVLVALVASVGALALTTHFVPLVTAAGVSRIVAATAAGTIGIASASGRILEGFLLDRFKGPAIGAISLMLPTAACLLVLFVPPSTAWAVAVALVLGAAVGAEVNILAYLTSRYFGVGHYGVLFGIVYSMVIVGGGLGPLLGGMIYDATKSYDYLAWTVLPLCVLCAVLILLMGPYPVAGDEVTEAPKEPAFT